MSDKQRGSDHRIDRRTFLLSAGIATTPLATAGTVVADSTDGEWYGYGDEEYGFAGYGGVPATE